MFYQDQISGTLERKILLSITRNAIVIVMLYLILFFFTTYHSDIIIETLYVLVMFVISFWLIKCHFSKTVKRISAIWIMITISMCFFSQGGFYGISSLDICCFILILPIIFQGKERIIFIIFFTAQILLLGFFQGFYPELILSDVLENDMSLKILNFLSRFGNMMYIGYIYKYEYDKEESRIVKINKQLKSMNEQIVNHNEKLEGLVNERTKTITWLNKKLLDCAFFNSHKVRGPLARIMGLVYLIQLATNKKGSVSKYEEQEYISKLNDSALELDTVIKEINKILENGMGELEYSDDKIPCNNDYNRY